MPTLPSPAPLPIYCPPSLATEPIGGPLAGTLRHGDPGREADIVGYVLVRLMSDGPDAAARWFSIEATYAGGASYADAIGDLRAARLADPSGPFRRLMPVYSDGTAA
jgi:hypothetical protein